MFSYIVIYIYYIGYLLLASPPPPTIWGIRWSWILKILDLSRVDTIIQRGVEKSLARPGRKQATATEDFYFHISYL